MVYFSEAVKQFIGFPVETVVLRKPVRTGLNRASKRLLIPLAVLTLVFFSIVGRNRFIDADEGFYLLASRLVFQHDIPYRDFLYTQMPLLPYLYGLWMQFVGVSWLSGRFLSACLTSALSMLLFIQICRQTKMWTAGICGVLLFASSTLIFGWMPLAKTYALSSVLLFSSYMIVSRLSSGSPNWLLFFGGMLLGLSVEVRLYFAALLPVFLLSIYLNRDIAMKRMALFYFGSGFLVAMLPAAYFLVFHHASFLFDVIGLHAIRSDEGLIGGFGQKALTLATSVTVGSKGNGLQLGTLLLVSSIAIRRKRLPDAARLSYWIAISLGFISLLPTPAYGQYLCVIVPFLLVSVACSLADLVISGRQSQRSRTVVLILCGLAAYMAIPITDYEGFFATGKNVIAHSPNEGPRDWRLGSVSRVSGAIDTLAQPGEKIISFWPGYLIEASAFPYPGLECDSGLTFSAELSPEQLAKYHIASRGQIETDIQSRIPRIVVIGNQEYWHKPRQPYINALARAGYAIDRKIGDTLIYIRR